MTNKENKYKIRKMNDDIGRHEWRDYILSTDNSHFSYYESAITFFSTDKKSEYYLPLHTLFHLDSEKFLHSIQEDNENIHMTLANCLCRNSDVIIISCFDHKIELQKNIKYDAIWLSIHRVLLPSDSGFYYRLSEMYMMNHKHPHPHILQAFEPIWEELQIVWI